MLPTPKMIVEYHHKVTDKDEVKILLGTGDMSERMKLILQKRELNKIKINKNRYNSSPTSVIEDDHQRKRNRSDELKTDGHEVRTKLDLCDDDHELSKVSRSPVKKKCPIVRVI